jgi:hypothetical protein
VSKPKRTLPAVLAKLEQIAAERERVAVATLAGPIRPACELHGWSPELGLRSNNFSAIASLCPHCTEEREQRRREEQQPAVETVELDLGSAGARADRLWAETKERRMQAGEVLAGSPAELEALRWIDSERVYVVAADNETAQARRIRHREFWGRKLGASSRRVYEPHPARAGD